MSEQSFRSSTISIIDLFDENKRTLALGRLMESNVVELWGRERMIVNMSQVNLIKEGESEIVFYFQNGNMLIVQNTGRVKYVR